MKIYEILDLILSGVGVIGTIILTTLIIIQTRKINNKELESKNTNKKIAIAKDVLTMFSYLDTVETILNNSQYTNYSSNETQQALKKAYESFSNKIPSINWITFNASGVIDNDIYSQIEEICEKAEGINYRINFISLENYSDDFLIDVQIDFKETVMKSIKEINEQREKILGSLKYEINKK